MNKVENNFIPLAAAYNLQELKGWIGKKMTVPVGKRGIIIFRDGKTQLFPPGTHQVVNPIQRLTKQAGGLIAGFIPEKQLPLHLKISNLLSGDNHLVDVSFMCELNIVDHKIFFEQEVIPHKTIQGPAFEWDDQESFKAVYQVINRYALEDLVSGAITNDLRTQITEILQSSLMVKGLQLASINLITIWPVEDRVRIEEKLFELNQKLSSIELDKKMSEIETNAQLFDFMNEFGIEWPKTSGVPLILEEKSIQSENPSFINWVRSEIKDNLPGRNFRIKSFWKKETKQKGKRRVKKVKFVPRILFVTLILIIACSVSGLFSKITEAAAPERRLDFYILIISIVISVILDSIVTLYKQWEENLSTDWDLEGAIMLEDLSRNNRERVDKIVREKSAAEISEQKRMVNDSRSRVYRSGNEDLALKLRQLESKLDESTHRVLDINFGEAPYLQPDLKISKRLWENMLDVDEHLLVQAAALTQDALGFQTKVNDQTLDDSFLNHFEDRLDRFLQNFGSRQRPLRAGENDMAVFQSANF